MVGGLGPLYMPLTTQASFKILKSWSQGHLDPIWHLFFVLDASTGCLGGFNCGLLSCLHEILVWWEICFVYLPRNFLFFFYKNIHLTMNSCVVQGVVTINTFRSCLSVYSLQKVNHTRINKLSIRMAQPTRIT
jgi:hypothetical protein